MSVILPNILAQHAEEAAFLWGLRDDAVGAAHYDVGHLRRLENRLAAHLDGLVVAGEAGRALCDEALERYPESGEMFAAATLALLTNDRNRLSHYLDVATGAEATWRGLKAAFGWVGFDGAAAPIAQWLGGANPVGRAVAVAAYRMHRRNPGSLLVAMIDDDDPAVRAEALRLAGVVKAETAQRQLEDACQSEDPDCRFWAIWSSVLLGDRRACPALAKMAVTPGPRQRTAIDLYVRAGGRDTTKEWVTEIVRAGRDDRLAIQAIGAIGDPVAVHWLLDRMSDPALARTAGEAFTLITGADLELLDLETDKPEDFDLPGPTDDPRDDNVDLDPDDNLPWPAPDLVETWWAENRQNLEVGQRYLLGGPIALERCRQILASGRQPHRRAAALELALQDPNSPLPSVKAITNWSDLAPVSSGHLG